ncbi:protealysin inhibitor emfourin [Microbacterium terricola]|uniref:Uncharacterized protein n=1 Tax=Microbacterium terricola TaxID=344163 RepID=A0ABM8DWT4_9MICO|nr:protealysin inhibitor emfourin [Microbacterium terricola]UYK39169.1 hypothetical protein OAU46_10725 [Microbacterium terricola]BDV30113.1 hypothetical protein Microterr_07730 [Microbacterium terricola]
MDPDTPHTTVIVVTVVRSGGFAGLTREWTAEPAPDEAPRWIALIDECPWGECAAPPSGADRFQWRIEAVRDDDGRAAQLDDGQLTGPWRELVDAVRAFASASA